MMVARQTLGPASANLQGRKPRDVWRGCASDAMGISSLAVGCQGVLSTSAGSGRRGDELGRSIAIAKTGVAQRRLIDEAVAWGVAAGDVACPRPVRPSRMGVRRDLVTAFLAAVLLLHYVAVTTLAGVSFFPLYAYAITEPTIRAAWCQESSVNVIAKPVRVAPIPKVIAHVPTNIIITTSGVGL
jgi:hypothetical protein